MATDRWIRFTVGIVLGAAAAYLLHRVRFVFITVALAAILAYAILPLVDAAARLRVYGHPLPRLAAVLGIMAGVALIVTGTIAAAAGPLGDETRKLVERTGQYRGQVEASFAHLRAWGQQNLPPGVESLLDDAAARAGDLIFDTVARLLRTTGEWLSHVVELVLVPILAFYFLVDLPALRDELLRFLPTSARRPVLVAARRLGRILAGYVRAQIILMVIAGIVVGLVMGLMRVPFATLLGLVAGLTRAIPIIGPVLGAIPIVGLAALQSPGLGTAVLIFFIVLQVVESKLIFPQTIGHELQLHAATIIIALLLGNAIFGLMGMFLAAPAAAFVKVLIEMWETGFADTRNLS